MEWSKVSESYYELRSRGNVEAMLKHSPRGWHCFLDATDMVSIVHIGTVQDLPDAKKTAQNALSTHRYQRRFSRRPGAA
jgi:hypothetical protein